MAGSKQGKYLASRPRPAMTIPASKPELEQAWLRLLVLYDNKPSAVLEAAIMLLDNHHASDSQPKDTERRG